MRRSRSRHARGELHRAVRCGDPHHRDRQTHGVVRKDFVGAFSATDLWAAVAELRDARPEEGRPPRSGGCEHR
jgi:hypothetical protein